MTKDSYIIIQKPENIEDKQYTSSDCSLSFLLNANQSSYILKNCNALGLPLTFWVGVNVDEKKIGEYTYFPASLLQQGNDARLIIRFNRRDLNLFLLQFEQDSDKRIILRKEQKNRMLLSLEQQQISVSKNYPSSVLISSESIVISRNRIIEPQDIHEATKLAYGFNGTIKLQVDDLPVKFITANMDDKRTNYSLKMKLRGTVANTTLDTDNGLLSTEFDKDTARIFLMKIDNGADIQLVRTRLIGQFEMTDYKPYIPKEKPAKQPPQKKETETKNMSAPWRGNGRPVGADVRTIRNKDGTRFTMDRYFG